MLFFPFFFIYKSVPYFFLQGHRLKNSKCLLLRELKRIPMDNKLLLTGTPLQNNLAELWSLLNFILPDIFSSHQEFESWYSSLFTHAFLFAPFNILFMLLNSYLQLITEVQEIYTRSIYCVHQWPIAILMRKCLIYRS